MTRWLLALLLAASASATACRSEPELPAAELDAERFEARGRVVAVRATELDIYHERIPSLRTALGTLEPMEPMTMVFGASTSAPIKGIAVGDIVRVEFTANYKRRPQMRLVAIEKLPPETKLDVP